MRRPLAVLLGLVSLVSAAFAVFAVAGAQEDDSAEKGAFVRFVEDTISTPDRKISLGSIDGALSSDVTISRITIADRDGVWLTIERPHLVWSRLALLRGRLDVESLEAESITVTRPPLPSTTVDPAASPGFALPELPVEVRIGKLAVPVIALAQPVIGEAVTLSVDGAVSLAGGTLDSNVQVQRTDAKPGRLALVAKFENESRRLDLDLKLEEPENGVVASLIGIPGRPAVAFSIAGSGPLTDFGADVALSAAGERRVSGRATITESAGAYRFLADVDATLAPLVDDAFRPYVEGASTLAIDATYGADGTVRLDKADIRSAVAALTASGAFAADGFPTALGLTGSFADPDGPVLLPGGGKVDRADVTLAFGGGSDRWTASFDLAGLDTGTLRTARTTLTAAGAAENLQDPARRHVSFEVAGALRDLVAADPNLSRALGGGFELTARGDWTAGAPVTVEIAEVKNPNAAVHFAGRIDGATLDGRYWLNAGDIAPFGGLAGAEVSGAATLDASGTIGAATGAFALTIASETVDLKLGSPQADALLAGRTTIAGGASRSVDGLRFSDLRIENPRLKARLDGAYDLDRADLSLGAELADLAVVAAGAAGPLSVSASITGEGTAPAVTASLSADRLVLDGKTLRQGLARFQGRIAGSAVDGALTLSGRLDEVAIDGKATVASPADGSRRIEGLAVTAGPNRLTGAVTARPDGLFEGGLSLDAPDLAVVAPLFLTEASGRLAAEVTLAAAEAKQSATVSATASGLTVEGNAVRSAELSAAIGDLFGVPTIQGRFEVRDVAAGGVAVDRVTGTAASRAGGGTDFDVSADLAEGTAAVTGALAAVEGGYDLTLSRLDAARAPKLKAALAAPVTVAVRGSTVTIPQATLTVGDGRVVVGGRVADTLDLAATVTRLPLALADAVAPDLGLGGTLSGSVAVTGPAGDPSARFDVRGDGVTAAALKRAGVAALKVTANGTYDKGTARFTADTDLGGGRVRVTGSAGSALDVDLRVDGLPLALADAASPGLGAQGRVDATAKVTGTPAAPQATFTVRGSGISVAASREAGVGALAVAAEGRFAGETVDLSTVKVTGPSGLALTASGRVPTGAGALDVGVRGQVPLSLADRTLAVRGTRVSGTAAVDLRIGGPVTDPRVTGAVTVSGASISDPATTMKITGIELRLALAGDRAVIERLSARVGGGSVSASGSVGIRPGSGFPVDVTVSLDRARVTDGQVVTAVLNGRLTTSGQAAGALAVGGGIDVVRAEITVPERLGSAATLLDVRHRLPPINVRRTLERAQIAVSGKAAGGGAAASSGGITVNVTVNAPRAVFVRGRGIDAELGGRVTVTGPVAAIQPVGSLTLIRGRLDVIGQRITFTSGEVTLVGDLDPYIDLVATTSSSTITVTASISGQASDPKLTLSSVPELPQDEVLAHFLFGRSLSDLSPVQIARLAVAAAQLAGGGGGTDVLGQLRNAVGLDDLDVVTDSKGNAAVQAGRYISDNVYLGVTAGANGQSNVSVNLDITDNLKARAEVGPQSGGKVGVFYEREY
ncbi:translocation/assembly module TamB domain-containing protein [Oharaeibacter diazotrophicus]|uniref:Autotransporter secretion inner membrane protein TamB n=2 Tax=Oharaeibacter diazotrophicus TaxID=1920512 RepID=A0A4R6R6Q5_9HYPH|nr:translocation/assembly module TamB domain-containing protein [Oharaeibacter diazotrophicus]TDP81549.1 autotransporter secretion inner membrane protein TamB [Oharaeibacter diazotrophicus]BBE73787.1 translocation and assembly module TamB [Pleomorphomonas sp. SM30]GLS75578.1 translocation/assembly module TamB [Oharaeibacter diazotrophicus]